MLVLCIFVFWLICGPAYASSYSDRLSDLFFRFVLGIDSELSEKNARIHRLQTEEDRRVLSEDPEGNRILY